MRSNNENYNYGQWVKEVINEANLHSSQKEASQQGVFTVSRSNRSQIGHWNSLVTGALSQAPSNNRAFLCFS